MQALSSSLPFSRNGSVSIPLPPSLLLAAGNSDDAVYTKVSDWRISLTEAGRNQVPVPFLPPPLPPFALDSQSPSRGGVDCVGADRGESAEEEDNREGGRS